ncbi:MAG TPA: helix-turn-helix transcriptional regulator [Patescibacteria group bacterium]|nr:helix-turn-helix transcriptional regulator [Gammaproteobacteria bacterium]HWA51504.1 helix-turn-helix transcriptional regulator [Patescibacteria group bacterium]
MENQDRLKNFNENAKFAQSVCTRFFIENRLNYFSFGSLDEKGNFRCFLTNPEWYQHFVSAQYPIFIPTAKDPSQKSYFYLWSEALSQPVVSSAYNNFGMANGITFVHKINLITEYFTYTSMRENHQAISFYLNNLDALRSFAAYFKEKANNLAWSMEKKLIVPPSDHYPLEINSNLVYKDTFDKNPNLNKTELHLTLKEIECIKYLRKSLTVKEIAKALSLSPRTVEDRLNMIREKLGCYRKSNIIPKLESVMPHILLID